VKARAGKRRGFTLIEVMIAIAILAMITVLLYSAFSSLKTSKDGIARIAGRYQEGRGALHRITSELQSAYLSAHVPIDLELQTVATAFIGKRGSPADRVDFNSFANRRFERDAHKSDQAEIGYFGMEDPEEGGRYDLVRRVSDRPDMQPDKGGRVEVLATDIDLFDLAYLDPMTGNWVEEWDSTQALDQGNRLPLQVRVKLVLNGGRRTSYGSGHDLIELVTKVPIPIQTPLAFAVQR
jgi:general secretion pathway protein J